MNYEHKLDDHRNELGPPALAISPSEFMINHSLIRDEFRTVRNRRFALGASHSERSDRGFEVELARSNVLSRRSYYIGSEPYMF